MPLSLNIQGYTIFWKHLYRRTYLPLEPSSVSGRSHLALGSSVRAWMPGNGICVISFQGSGKAYFPVTVLQVPPSAAVSCSKLIKAPQVLSHTGSCHFLKPWSSSKAVNSEPSDFRLKFRLYCAYNISLICTTPQQDLRQHLTSHCFIFEINKNNEWPYVSSLRTCCIWVCVKCMKNHLVLRTFGMWQCRLGLVDLYYLYLSMGNWGIESLRTCLRSQLVSGEGKI